MVSFRGLVEKHPDVHTQTLLRSMHSTVYCILDTDSILKVILYWEQTKIFEVYLFTSCLTGEPLE